MLYMCICNIKVHHLLKSQNDICLYAFSPPYPLLIIIYEKIKLHYYTTIMPLMSITTIFAQPTSLLIIFTSALLLQQPSHNHDRHISSSICLSPIAIIPGIAIVILTLSVICHLVPQVMKLAAGDYFGERALLELAPRAANVKAAGKVTCEVKKQ